MLKIVNNTNTSVVSMFNKELLAAWEAEKAPIELSDLFTFEWVWVYDEKRMIISDKE